MRFLPTLLARLFPVEPLPLAPIVMDVEQEEPRDDDPIAAALNAAVTEHEQTAAGIRQDYDSRLRGTIDELLERIGQRTR